MNEEIRIYNHENELEQYKDVLSENFQNMIRESYGTVIEDEDDNLQQDLKEDEVEEVLLEAVVNDEIIEEEKVQNKKNKVEEKKIRR